MADKKISQLPSVTTPLGGTEQFAVVQSGDTKKVTVDSLTQGRTVKASGLQVPSNTGIFLFTDDGGTGYSLNGGTATPSNQLNEYVGGLNVGNYDSAGNYTVKLGNLVIGTSGKGIDTSAAHAVTFNINSSEAARIHASKGVSIGNTVDPGVNNLSVTGGITNANIKTGNGLLTNNLSAPEIMFSAAGQGIYIVFAYIEAYDPNDWSAQATVTSSGGGALKLTAVNNAGMEITVSGTDVLCQQIGGGGSPLGTKYVYQKII